MNDYGKKSYCSWRRPTKAEQKARHVKELNKLRNTKGNRS